MERNGGIASQKRYRTLSLEELEIPQSDLDFIFKNLNAQTKAPLLVRSGDEPFLVSAAHYPSSQLCFGVRLRASLSLAKKICRDIYGDAYIAPSFSKVRESKRANEKEKNEILNVIGFVSELERLGDVLRETDVHKAARESAKAVRAIAEFVTCETDVIFNATIPDCFDYDVSLFSMFALCSLLFAYDKARSRSATLEFSEISGNLLCSFSFELDEPTADESCFNELSSHMEALGMYFAFFKKDRFVRVEACAVRLDLSLLDLKNDPRFE